MKEIFLIITYWLFNDILFELYEGDSVMISERTFILYSQRRAIRTKNDLGKGRESKGEEKGEGGR